MKAKFSPAVLNELKQRGATEKDLETLVLTIMEIPAAGHIFDTSDNAVSLYGYPVSLIRDHAEGTITILTKREAHFLDSLADGNLFTLQ